MRDSKNKTGHRNLGRTCRCNCGSAVGKATVTAKPVIGKAGTASNFKVKQFEGVKGHLDGRGKNWGSFETMRVNHVHKSGEPYKVSRNKG